MITQTRCAMENRQAVLRAANLTFEDVGTSCMLKGR